MGQIRRAAGNVSDLDRLGLQVGVRADQSLGVRVIRVTEHLARRRLLDELAGVHDQHPVRELEDGPQVVADQEDGEAELLLQDAQPLQDLALNDDVQAGRRLVEQDEARLERQGQSQGHPLLHPPGELVGVEAHEPLLCGSCDRFDVDRPRGWRRFGRPTV
jgi:hypothetical protein